MCLDTRACIILMNSTPGDIYPHIANVSVLAYMKENIEGFVRIFAVFIY